MGSLTPETKALLGTIAVGLTFIGYIPYFRSILAGKTKPHLYSWLIWLLDGLIIFALQVTHGGGPGSFVVLTATLMSLVVVILTLRRKEKRDITTSDKVFSIMALIALGLWLFAKQPLLSAILIMTVDVLGFVPTIRKTWKNPYSENPTFYIVNVIRFMFAFAALREYSIITTLYPGAWFFGNAAFVVMLLQRRAAIRQSK